MNNLLSKLYILKKISEKLEKDHVKECAAQCSYYMILSIVPFIMFFITLSSQIPMFNKNIILDMINGYLPDNTYNIISSLLDEIYDRSIGTLSITIITILWSASKGVYYLSRGLKKIYKARKRIYPLERLHGVLYTIAMFFIFYSVLILFVLGKKIHVLVSEYLPNIAFITSLILKLRWIVLLVIICLVFTLMYQFIPRSKMKLKDQIIGALFAAISWVILSWGMGFFVNIFTGFSKIYGSLTTIMLIMIWFYFCMYFILVGGELNYFIYQYNSNSIYRKVLFPKIATRKENKEKLIKDKEDI